MPYKAISSAFYGFTINSSHRYNVLYVQYRIYRSSRVRISGAQVRDQNKNCAV